MTSHYADGRFALGRCARSGRKMLLRDMVRDGYEPNLLVDPKWYEPPEPAERLYPTEDAIALRVSAPESSRQITNIVTWPNYSVTDDVVNYPLRENEYINNVVVSIV